MVSHEKDNVLRDLLTPQSRVLLESAEEAINILQRNPAQILIEDIAGHKQKPSVEEFVQVLKDSIKSIDELCFLGRKPDADTTYLDVAMACLVVCVTDPNISKEKRKFARSAAEECVQEAGDPPPPIKSVFLDDAEIQARNRRADKGCLENCESLLKYMNAFSLKIQPH